MWRILGASATGKGHVRAGSGCQDAFGWAVTEHAVCLVVADGAGSRPESAKGSRAAVDAVLSFVDAADHESPDGGIGGAFLSAVAAVESLSTQHNCPPDRFATTLAVVIIRQDGAWTGQIGDSIVVARDAAKVFQAVEPQPRFEYANETVFITGSKALDNLRMSYIAAADLSGIALSTDGLRFKILEDLNTGEPFAPFFKDVFEYASHADSSSESLERFLDNLDDQSDDDKTLVVAVHGPMGLSRDSGPSASQPTGTSDSGCDVDTDIPSEPNDVAD